MNNAVNFLYESGISLSFLSLIYLIFLRKETFFRINRIFLIFSVIFSLILPLLHIPVYAPQSNLIGEVRITPYQNLLETVIVSSQGFTETVETAVVSSTLILFGYLLGFILFLVVFLYRSFQLQQLMRNSEIIPSDSYSLVLVNEHVSPFSFLKYIFVSRNFREMEGHERMLLHEMEHVKQGHTYDVLILEILTILQWFNPFIWLLRRAIRENHEFLADKAVLSAGIRPSDYKELLLNQFVGGPYLATSHFNYSLIRNRIRMMTRIESPRIALAKILPGILIGAMLVVIFACEHKNAATISGTHAKNPPINTETGISGNQWEDNVTETGGNPAGTSTVEQPQTTPGNLTASFRGDTLSLTGAADDLRRIEEMLASGNLRTVRLINNNRMEIIQTAKTIATVRQPDAPASGNEEQVFFIVEEMPEFPGGEAALRNFIARTVQYPAIAQEKGLQGRVYVQFVVTKDGSVADAKIVRGVDPVLDQEAMRVVNSLPRWIPGKQGGKAVAVSYTVPISFVLQ